jgi:hypothetical protein
LILIGAEVSYWRRGAIDASVYVPERLIKAMGRRGFNLMDFDNFHVG